MLNLINLQGRLFFQMDSTAEEHGSSAMEFQSTAKDSGGCFRAPHSVHVVLLRELRMPLKGTHHSPVAARCRKLLTMAFREVCPSQLLTISAIVAQPSPSPAHVLVIR